MRIRRSLAGVTAAALLGALAVPLSAMAVDIQVPARKYLVKQDAFDGFVGKLATIVNKPLPKGATFALPALAPTAVGGTLKFFKVGTPGVWEDLNLPAAQWIPRGPGGSRGYLYLGDGSLTDPCKIVLVKKKLIKAVCKGPNSTDSPSPYSIPINQVLGAAWELVIGGDKYCAESSNTTAAEAKRNSNGLYVAIGANAPSICPVAIGSASKAFLNPAQSLLQ